VRKHLFLGLIGLLLVILAACGSSATAVPAAPVAPVAAVQPAAPAAQAAVAKPAAPAAVAAPAVSPALAAYAAKYAGAPGAIYVGDLKQLVGPAPTKELGDFDGNVPLDSLQRHLFVYESDYYKSLLEKAKLTNPTPLVSTGQTITMQYACLNRSLGHCKLSHSYFFPNLLARTNGQLNLVSTSWPELGISGTDLLSLVDSGTVAFANINAVSVAGVEPAIELQELFGLYPDRVTQFKAVSAIFPDLEKLVEGATGGGKVVHFSWISGNDFYFYTKKPLKTLADFKGMKTRAFGLAISDWILGMGAEAQVVPFSDVYTALERGILDAGVTGGDAGHGQRWYEVTKHISGPLVAWPSHFNVMNKKVWEKLPPDLQQIMIEEGAKFELEGLRIGAIQNELGLEKNIREGMEYLEFSPEIRARSDAAVFERVVPNWVKRVGPDKPFIKVFNEHVGPRVGMHVQPDGSVIKVPITLK
jgi:TRAP-type C4-dicarboxylate transport system substrate-binding protein